MPFFSFTNSTCPGFLTEMVDVIRNIEAVGISEAQCIMLKAFHAFREKENSMNAEGQPSRGDSPELPASPVIEIPYLPPLSPEKMSSTYTLVLDLDETLVHYEDVRGVSARCISLAYQCYIN